VSSKTSHPIYSRDATVVLARHETDKFSALQRAIAESRFFDNVELALERTGKPRKDFLIAIKPNLMTASVREGGSPIYTDPQLVEYLIEGLRDRGFRDIAVVEARNVYDYAYEGRSVRAVAELAGYSGNGYRIEDLSEQKEPFDYGGVLGLHVVGKTWRDADYRVSFAKNKTHWQCYYTGCMKNIYGCLPEWDKMKSYHGKGREFYQCCILILDKLPVGFGFLDAWVSADGFAGHVRDGKPNQTKTVLASDNILALDWVMGEKMSLDPKANYVIQEALRYWGITSLNITRSGDMTPWRPWTNVRPLSVKVLDLIEEHYRVSRFFSRAFASEQDERFRPVQRGRWFFGALQKLSKLVERLMVSKT